LKREPESEPLRPMKLLETPITLSEKVRYLTEAIVEGDSLEGPLKPENQAAWQRVLDKLAVWDGNPHELEDEDFEVPVPSALRLASAVAGVMRERGIDSPQTVVPNGDGGLVFRWRSGETAWTMEFESDGSIDSSLVRNGKLIRRHSLHDDPRDEAQASH
jgi:hypothetical protein